MPTQSQARYWTLKDYIISLYQQQKTETSEFKAMLHIYGREKLENWWHEYQSELRKKHEKHQESYK
jgi:hypothetical protein